jgi:ABC-type multidrug transport system ATPase subunit
MAQRLGFIFALTSKPEIVLMDEPTSALDSEVIGLFTNKIKEYSKLHNSIVLFCKA